MLIMYDISHYCHLHFHCDFISKKCILPSLNGLTICTLISCNFYHQVSIIILFVTTVFLLASLWLHCNVSVCPSSTSLFTHNTFPPFSCSPCACKVFNNNNNNNNIAQAPHPVTCLSVKNFHGRSTYQRGFEYDEVMFVYVYSVIQINFHILITIKML